MESSLYGFLCLCNTYNTRGKFGKETEAHWVKMAKLNCLLANAALTDHCTVVPSASRHYVADVETLLQDMDLDGVIYPGLAVLYK